MIVFTPFFLGASIHVPDAEDISSPGRLAEWMDQHKVTVTHLTPGKETKQMFQQPVDFLIALLSFDAFFFFEHSHGSAPDGKRGV